MSDLGSLLLSGATQLDIRLNAFQRDTLLKLIAELSDWNARVNLTAIRDPADMVRKHLLDSLSIQPHLHGQNIADVGSGAGFPGLPLAIVNPDRQFTLIEATAKKVRFIEHAVTELKLHNVQAVHARAESWRPPQPFDSVTSRALGKVDQFVRFTEHFCARDGRLLAMKGQYPHEELSALPKGWQVLAVHRLHVPGLDAERHLVELARGS
jgi:16S rRNA (guanine527-N7)-methyltransferase